MLEHINFSLSNRCNAKCIWCPTSRGTKNNFDLPFDLVKKVVDEVSSPAFPYQIKMIHVSENGEALYNPDFLRILRYIRNKMPWVAVNLLSNFGLMTNRVSETLLKEGLLTSLQVNIDGHDEETYRAVKGISYKTVIKNVKFFIEMMEKYQPDFDFCINVMPASEYAVTVKTYFGENPDRMPASKVIPHSTFSETERVLREFVPPNVRIRRSKSGLWSERKLAQAQKDVDLSQYECPQLYRVQHEAYIAPNGDWYACCLDDNNDLVLGNVKEQTMLEIWDGEVRREFLDKLVNRRFNEIGYPCNTVLACQTITIKDYDEMTKDIPVNAPLDFK